MGEMKPQIQIQRVKLGNQGLELATKFGIALFKEGGHAINGRPEYVRECCEARLMCRVDASVPIEDTVGELKKLVEEGKIKYLCLSVSNTDTIRRAHAVHPIIAVQLEYSMDS